MGCLFRSPTGALEEVRKCVVGVLSQQPFTVPGTVAVGPHGVGNAYKCCDTGLLTIEWMTTTPDQELSRTSVNGKHCREELYAEIRVGVDRCVQTFDVSEGGISDGGAVDIDIRNQAGLDIDSEAWAVIQGLVCCINSPAWEDCDVRFMSHQMGTPNGGCWGYTILLRAYLLACCT